MGIVTLEQSSQLFWLGRYVERALMTSRAIVTYFDRSLDKDKDAYQEYLNHMGLPDVYGSGTQFAYAMLLDKSNAASVHYCLERAFDNAIVLREAIGTPAFSYIQLALNQIARMAEPNQSLNIVGKQIVEDYLLAFVGSINEDTPDLDVRSVISLGRATERLDLNIRLEYPAERVLRVFRYFRHVVRGFPENTPYHCNAEPLATLSYLEEMGEDYATYRVMLLSALGRVFG